MFLEKGLSPFDCRLSLLFGVESPDDHESIFIEEPEMLAGDDVVGQVLHRNGIILFIHDNCIILISMQNYINLLPWHN